MLIKLRHVFGSFTIDHEFYNYQSHVEKEKMYTCDFYTKAVAVANPKFAYQNFNTRAEDNTNVPFITFKSKFKKYNDQTYTPL
jgi:hypothetical protein